MENKKFKIGPNSINVLFHQKSEEMYFSKLGILSIKLKWKIVIWSLWQAEYRTWQLCVQG